MDYVDITPDPASSAARNTAKTAPTWETWASAATGTIDNAAISSKDTVVTRAFNTFFEDIKPRVTALSKLAEKQGVDLGSAVQTALDGDHQTKRDQQPGLNFATQQQGPAITRPLNAD